MQKLNNNVFYFILNYTHIISDLDTLLKNYVFKWKIIEFTKEEKTLLDQSIVSTDLNCWDIALDRSN